MCGRYGRRGDKQRIAEWMQTHDTKPPAENKPTFMQKLFGLK